MSDENASRIARSTLSSGSSPLQPPVPDLDIAGAGVREEGEPVRVVRNHADQRIDLVVRQVVLGLRVGGQRAGPEPDDADRSGRTLAPRLEDVAERPPRRVVVARLRYGGPWPATGIRVGWFRASTPSSRRPAALPRHRRVSGHGPGLASAPGAPRRRARRTSSARGTAVSRRAAGAGRRSRSRGPRSGPPERPSPPSTPRAGPRLAHTGSAASAHPTAAPGSAAAGAPRAQSRRACRVPRRSVAGTPRCRQTGLALQAPRTPRQALHRPTSPGRSP